MKAEAACRQWNLTRREVAWTLWRAALVMALTFVPYLIASWLTPPGMRYTWLLYNPDEPNVHLQWMRQAYEGKFFFGNLFTTERAPDQFTNVFLWVLGRSTAWKHALWGGYTLIVEYHVARFFSGLLLLVAIYLLAAQLTDNVRYRQTTFWLCALSSGLGWLNHLFSLGFQPADVNVNLVMPEAITFLSILLYPLFAFSVFLMVMTFTLALANRERNSVWLHASAAFCAALLANVHTYNMIPLWLTLGVWSLSTRKPRFIGGLFIAMLPSLAVVAYQFFLFRNNIVFRMKALTITATPPWYDLFMTYGFVGILALVGVWRFTRQWDKRSSLALIWAIVGLIVIYIPTSLVSFQRKMIEGWHIPLCFLAAYALCWRDAVFNEVAIEEQNDAKTAKDRGRQRIMAGIAVVITVPSNIAFLHLALSYVVENNASRAGVLMPPYYLRDEEMRALDWLANAKEEGAVLCAPFLGAHIPGRTGKRVYVGHWAETISFPNKLHTLRRFYEGRMPEYSDVWGFTQQERIVLVVFGRYEKLMFPNWSPPPWLRREFQQGETTIYRVDFTRVSSKSL